MINMIQELIHTEIFDMFCKIILISLLAGLIGYEREAWRKPAGFRTYVLVGISAVLVVSSGEYLHDIYGGDPSRIPAQLLSGIGFLGAGTILRDGNNIKGLTTAAGLLSVTAIGLVVGTGAYLTAILGSLVVYIVLSHSHLLSTRLDHVPNQQIKITTLNAKKHLERIQKIIAAEEIDITRIQYGKNNSDKDELYIELTSRNDVSLNNVFAKISEIDDVESVESVKVL